MSNIAEGFESDSQPQFVKFLGYARASAGEVRAQLYVALDAGHLTQAQFEQLFDLAEKCSRQLSRFISYLKSSPSHSVRENATVYEVEMGEGNVPTFKTFQRKHRLGASSQKVGAQVGRIANPTYDTPRY